MAMYGGKKIWKRGGNKTENQFRSKRFYFDQIISLKQKSIGESTKSRRDGNDERQERERQTKKEEEKIIYINR